MNRQYAVTESKGMKWGLLMSKEQSDSGKCTLKNLKTREQFQDITQEEAAEKILSDK